MAGPLTADRVKQTSTTTGTGTLNLDATIPTGARSFVSGIGSTNSCYYCIAHQTANEWEVGVGTVTSGTPDTLSRTTVLSSSNSGSAVTLSAGTKDVFVVDAAKYGSPLVKIPTTHAIRPQIETNFSSIVGNARGNGAIDLQPFRDTATQVASGNYSFIGGGTRNTVSNTGSFIGCGNQNTISGVNSVITGGAKNIINNSYATIGGGYLNKNYAGKTFIGGGRGNQINAYSHYSTLCGGYANHIYNNYAFIGGGVGNACHHIHACIVGGQSNYTSGDASIVLGGRFNAVTANYGVASGVQALANKVFQVAHANGKFSNQGDAQVSTQPLRIQTTDATATEMSLDGTGSNYFVLPNNTAWTFDILVVARRVSSTAECAGFQIFGCVLRDSTAASTAFVGTPTVTVLGRNNAAWTVAVSVNTTSGRLVITVTGEAAKTIHWVAYARLAETSG